MIDPSEGNQIQQNYLEILDAILKKIQEKGKFYGFEPGKNVSILIGTKSVYRNTLDQKPENAERNTITPEQVDLIKNTLSDPHNLKGSVRILIGNEKVYHANNGELVTDKLGLSPPSQAQAQVQVVTLDSLQQQIDALNQKVQEQQKVIDGLRDSPTEERKFALAQLSDEFAKLQIVVTQQQQTLAQLGQRLESALSQESPSPKNTNLQNWIGAVENKVRKTAANLWKQTKEALSPRVNNLRSEVEVLRGQIHEQLATLEKDLRAQVDTQIQGLKAHVHQQVGNVRQEVQQQVSNVYWNVQSQVDDLAQQVRQTPIYEQIETQAWNVRQGVEAVQNNIHQGVETVQNSVRQGVEQAQNLADAISGLGNDIYADVRQGVEVVQEIAGAVSEHAQTAHKELTEIVQDVNSKATNTVKESVRVVSEAVSEVQGKAIEKALGATLRLFGEKQSDGSLTFESKNYNFHQQGETISITSKDGRGEIFKNGNLTDAATEADLINLIEIKEDIDNYLTPDYSQSQSQSLKRGGR